MHQMLHFDRWHWSKSDLFNKLRLATGLQNELHHSISFEIEFLNSNLDSKFSNQAAEAGSPFRSSWFWPNHPGDLVAFTLNKSKFCSSIMSRCLIISNQANRRFWSIWMPTGTDCTGRRLSGAGDVFSSRLKAFTNEIQLIKKANRIRWIVLNYQSK